MATLTETLATSKSRDPYRTGGYTQSGGVRGMGGMNNPYGTAYGANLSYGPTSQPQDSLYQNLLARTQQESARALPSATYQANYNFDPILARLEALGQMTVEKARDEAASLRKRALVDTGDEGLARELAADDPNTIEAARKNEFGTRQLLTRDFTERGRQLNEAMNNANLYYSGSMIDELARQEFGRRQAEQEWLTRFRDLYGGIGENLLRREEQAASEAAAAAAAAGGFSGDPLVDYGDGGAGGGGGFGPGAGGGGGAGAGPPGGGAAVPPTTNETWGAGSTWPTGSAPTPPPPDWIERVVATGQQPPLDLLQALGGVPRRIQI